MSVVQTRIASIICLLVSAMSLPAHADDTLTSSLTGLFSSDSSTSSSPAVTGYRGGQQIDATRASIAYASDDASNATRIDATNEQNCTAVKQSASEWKTVAIQRSVAPSPVNTIRDTTCFADVISIQIPRTGYGMLDALMPELLKFATTTLCNSTNGFWAKITKLASSGSIAGLMGNAVNVGTKYISQTIATVKSTPYTPKNNTVVSSVVVRQPNVPSVPSSGSSTYGMCGPIALFTEDVSAKYSQHAGASNVTKYTQSTMSNGVGYSLSFTTGQDTAALNNNVANENPEFFVTTIAAKITNPATVNVDQLMVISTSPCDFQGDQGLAAQGTTPSVQFVTTTGDNGPEGVKKLAPNTTYYINYVDRVEDQMTCPSGASCEFEIDFYNTNPVPTQIDKLIR